MDRVLLILLVMLIGQAPQKVERHHTKPGESRFTCCPAVSRSLFHFDTLSRTNVSFALLVGVKQSLCSLMQCTFTTVVKIAKVILLTLCRICVLQRH